MANTLPTLRLGLPKGRMQQGVLSLLQGAGINVQIEPRGYRATTSLEAVEVKLLKPQNLGEMLQAGSRDLGFAGADWVAELGLELVELLDTGLDPVRLVAAAPKELLEQGKLPRRPLVIASEYPRLTEAWIRDQGLQARVVRSYGATEVFPPEDADLIVDNTSTGATLRANGLTIVDVLMRSSTRLYANPRALDDPARRARIEDLVLLIRSVLEARSRAMLELNVTQELLAGVVEILPAMRTPTVSPLLDQEAFAVKVAVPRSVLPTLIPKIKARGGTDLVVSAVAQIVL